MQSNKWLQKFIFIFFSETLVMPVNTELISNYANISFITNNPPEFLTWVYVVKFQNFFGNTLRGSCASSKQEIATMPIEIMSVNGHH